MYGLLLIALFTQGFRALDKRILLYKPYYAVHVVHNLAITALTVGDVWASFTRFGAARPINWLAVYLCYALHLYHVIDYYPVFRFDDWLHHGLMIGVALPLGCSVPSGALLGCNLFFTTGLPGAISYALLFAERNAILDRPIVKRYNAATNLWLRAPGCVAHAALTVALALTSGQNMFSSLLISGLTAWNGLYFMRQALQAEWVSQANEPATVSPAAQPQRAVPSK
jgi:hypothetical protein